MKAINYSLIIGLALIVVTLSVTTSCNKDKTPVIVPTDCPDTISFAGIVEPMMEQNCSTSGCHDASTATAGYDLDGYSNISANASAILNVIRHEGGVTPMPYLQPKFNDSLIQQFNCWISQGKLNN